MAVSALDENRLSVHEQLLVLYLHLAETGAHRNRLYVLVLLLHGDNHLIQIRSLGGPLQRVLHVELHGSVHQSHVVSLLLLHLRRVDYLAAHNVAVRSDEVDDEFGVALSLERNGERSVLVFGVEVWRNAHVVDVSGLRARVEEAVASHTREAPEVLVLAVRAVAPAESLESDEVVALLKERSDVELHCRLRVLAVANEVAVHPEVHVRRNRSEVSYHLASVP